MCCWLAGLMMLLLGAVAGAESPPPASDRPAVAPAPDVVRTLALLEQIDPQSLPPDQRQTLYFAVVDALLADGQGARALAFLARARQSAPPDTADGVDAQIQTRLQGVPSPPLMAALQAGSPLAALLRPELARRAGVSLSSPAGERTIGVLLPLSGRYAPAGLSVQQGLELARATLPAAWPVRFDYHDTSADSTVAARLVQELAARPELLAVIGPLTSSEAATASALAEGERLPLLLLASREGATGGQVFRNALTPVAQARALADFAGRGEGLKRFVILHPANRHGELFAGLFQAAVEGQGGQVLARQGYPPGAVDLRQQLQVLAADARRSGHGPPEALFLPDDARQVAQIIPQLAFARLDQVQLLGTSAWNDPELVRLAGPQSEGAVFVEGFFAASHWPEVRDFVVRFQATHGAPPDILAAQGYDAARILLTLLERPEVHDRESLCQALATLRDFPGVTGLTRFGSDGEAEKPLFLLQVQDGNVVQIN